MCVGAPPVVHDYLSEGNNKDDLIEWIWNLISDEEKGEILKEARDNLAAQQKEEANARN